MCDHFSVFQCGGQNENQSVLNNNIKKRSPKVELSSEENRQHLKNIILGNSQLDISSIWAKPDTTAKDTRWTLFSYSHRQYSINVETNRFDR